MACVAIGRYYKMSKYIYNEWAEKFIWWCHICCWWLFWLMGSKHCKTDGRSMWTARRSMLKNKPHLVMFHESILVSWWTFLTTLVCVCIYLSIYIYIYIYICVCVCVDKVGVIIIHFWIFVYVLRKCKYLQVLILHLVLNNLWIFLEVLFYYIYSYRFSLLF